MLPGGGIAYFPDLIVGINGTVSGFASGGNGSFDTLLTTGTLGNDNLFSSISPYINGNGVAFQSAGINFNLLAPGSNWYLYNYTFDPASVGTLVVSLSQ